MVQFQALGGLTVTDNGDEVSIGGPRQRRLLAMLLIHRNAVVSVDRLADAVFAGEPTAAAGTTLRSYVARIRKVVDGNGLAATVVTQAPGYVLRLPSDAVDVTRFEGLVADGGSRLGRGDAVGASSVLREALALWRGEAYAEFADEEWARPEAQRLEELRLVAHERLVEAELACGRAAGMIPEIESLVAGHPLREAFRAQLMLALYRAGRHADALRVFREYRQVLVDELGLDPSPALTELERRVLNHDPALMLVEPAGLPLRGYRLGERLGTGRDGTVFAAALPGVERDFVVRVIREEIADRPEFVRSFDATAHRVASLRHPAVAPIHDYWREPGAAYLVMRRMHGGTLAERLYRGPLTDAALATLVGRIGGALVAAADAGVVHGRVTADSVLFDAAGDPYLADFALGPTTLSAGDDVRDFAVMVNGCLPGGGGPVGDVVARGVATVGRPSMAEFVAMVVAGLTDVEPAVDGVVPNPYKGLRAFDEADAADFFGRAELVDEIVARLGRDDGRGRLVLVVGGSGTGKSSVVRAGLLPRLRRGEVPGSGQWFTTTMLPGSSPFKELAESLQRVAVVETTGMAEQLTLEGGIDRVVRRVLPRDGQLVLVVDQFEELFTLAPERDQRAFLDGVMHAVEAADSRLRVVATLRADFYDRPLAAPRFGAAVYEATVTVAAMTPADLEAAVVEPVERVGGRVDRALVAELVNAVADQPAALPSLQFALYELAERSQDKHLTLAAYRELGGVEGAIASRAELLYSSLDDPDRAAVRQMFERLVVVHAEGETTRRRAARGELSALASDQSMDATIDRWAQARLLTLDCHPQTRVPTVELAHEALLREWPRLRDWIDDDREAIGTLGHLREAATGWVELERDPGALYRGARLEVALDVAHDHSDELPEPERSFLDASRQARDREQQREREHIERQGRANRRLRIQLAAITVALVVALAGGFVALDQRREANLERSVATARELAAASTANLADDPELSILLALTAIDETRSGDGTVLPEAEAALHRAVTSSRVVLSVPGVGGALDWSPDGSIFVTEGPEGSGVVDIRDADTGESVLSFPGHDIDVNDVAFSSDGSMLATTGDDGAVRVWDPTTGDELSVFQDDAGGGPVWGPSFSPDGSRVAAAWHDDGLVRVIDIGTGEIVTEIESGTAFGTAFSPDGERLVGGAVDAGFAGVVDVETGEVIFTLDEDEWIRDAAWSPDGRWIATTGTNAARIWDADTGEQRFTVAGHSGQVSGLDWSPDSTRLATAGIDRTARVTEIADEGVRELLSVSSRDTRSGLAAVAFSPEGGRIMAGDFGINAVTVWDVSPTAGAEWSNVAGAPGTRSAAAFTPDGRSVVVSTGGGTASILDVETGQNLAVIGPRSPTDDDIYRLALSADGQLLATTAVQAPVNVWDVQSGESVFAVYDNERWVADLAWSRERALLAVVGNNDEGGVVTIVDRAGTEVATRRESGLTFQSVSISPDGRLVATTHAQFEQQEGPMDTTVTLWDWERGEIVGTIDTAVALSTAVFDPTGARIVTVGRNDAIAEIWDVQTGERVATLADPPDSWDVIFSPDGGSVATSHADGTVRLWDSRSGVQRLVLEGHGDAVSTVVFSQDASKLASVGDDGVVRVWALSLDDVIAIASDRLTRGFSDDECRQYLHIESCPRT